MKAAEYCQNKAAPPGSSFYYSTLFYSSSLQEDLHCLYAFLTEIENIVQECSDPGVARIKLAWWQEEIERAGVSKARHPVSRELNRMILSGNIEAESLRVFITRTDQRISDNRFADYGKILTFYADSSGLIWESMAGLCQPQHKTSLLLANTLGTLFRYFDNLQSARILLNNQQFHAPDDDLARFGIEVDELLLPAQEETTAFFALQIDRLIEDLKENSQLIAAKDRRPMLFLIIMSQIIIKTCEEIRNDGYRLMDTRVSLTPLRKLWIAWFTRIKR